jgi:aminoacrylate peracid reductase
MAKKQYIQPGWAKYLNHPKLTYAPAVRVGNLLFVSGLTGVDPQTGNLVSPGDIVAQMRQIYKNLADILKAAGATPENIVQTTDYITTQENYKKTGDVRREFFGDSRPTSVGVVVKELLRPDALIEVSAIAVMDS